jgi:hypothetical protein
MTGPEHDLTSSTYRVQATKNLAIHQTVYENESSYTLKQAPFPGCKTSTVITENSRPRLRLSWIRLTLRRTKLTYCFTKVFRPQCARRYNRTLTRQLHTLAPSINSVLGFLRDEFDVDGIDNDPYDTDFCSDSDLDLSDTDGDLNPHVNRPRRKKR